MKKLVGLLILIPLVLTVSCGDKDKKDSKMSDAKESAVTLAAVSYTHLTLPTIYTV